MSTLQPFTDEQVAEASFHLFACSVPARYARVSSALASETGLEPRIRQGHTHLEPLIGRAYQLFEEASLSAERSLSEVALALLMPVLARFPVPSVAEFLQDVETSSGLALSWLRHLAGTLIRERAIADNTSVQTAVSIGGSFGQTCATVEQAYDVLDSHPFQGYAPTEMYRLLPPTTANEDY